MDNIENLLTVPNSFGNIKQGRINQNGCKIKGQVINNHNNINLIYLMN